MTGVHVAGADVTGEVPGGGSVGGPPPGFVPRSAWGSPGRVFACLKVGCLNFGGLNFGGLEPGRMNSVWLILGCLGSG